MVSQELVAAADGLVQVLADVRIVDGDLPPKVPQVPYESPVFPSVETMIKEQARGAEMTNAEE